MDALAPVPSRKSLVFQLLTRGMPTKPDDPAIGEWRQHWIVVFVSMIGLGIGTRHVFYMGIFIAPLEHEFGWTRAEISSGLLMNSIVGIAFSPFVGWVIDRLGTRRVGIPGIAIYCTAIALLSCAGPEVGTWWGLWFLVASGAVLIKPTVWALTVSQRFDRSRALALAIVLSGSGLVQRLCLAWSRVLSRILDGAVHLLRSGQEPHCCHSRFLFCSCVIKDEACRWRCARQPAASWPG
jgi:MFS family permease